jgi:putative ABC transport system substrate-binding protein
MAMQCGLRPDIFALGLRECGIMMRRRAFITLAGAGVIAWPLAVQAQQAQKIYRVGLIFTSARLSDMAGQNPVNPAVRMFVHTLRDLGYVEGSNLSLERRSALGQYERSPEILRELVALKVDVIVTFTNPMAHAAKDVTRTIPIVGVTRDPVGDGLVQSLARPGANITGLTVDVSLDIVGKRIQLLKEIVPTLSRLVLLQTKAEPLSEWERGETSVIAAQQLGAKLLIAEATPPDYTDAFGFIQREKPGGMLVGDGAGNFSNLAKIVRFATENRLPTMSGFREYVAAASARFARRRARAWTLAL